MRLWSIHPCYLDTKGLLALWREALLAQKVLQGETKGYKYHPQLERFKKHQEPSAAIGEYLFYVLKEAEKRNYRFDSSKIIHMKEVELIPIKDGQIRYEFDHLLGKLAVRDAERYIVLKNTSTIKPHPIFSVRQGGKEEWER